MAFALPDLASVAPVMNVFDETGLVWIFSAGCALGGLRLLAEPLRGWSVVLDGGRERKALLRVSGLLRELEETLAAGLLPDSSRWDELKALRAPWGTLAYESLKELRSAGGAILPTLRRLRALAEAHRVALAEGKARTSQALAQALVCAALVPVLGLILYSLFPGVDQAPLTWVLGCGLAGAFSGAGALWMHSLSESARWGGLPPSCRNWLLAAQCAGERFLALVRAGTPPDLAWTRALELLGGEAPELALEWGHSVWTGKPETSGAPISARVIAEAGSSLRRSIQLSLMEGRPCTERVEAALLALQQEMRAQVERELTLLGTRALKPLFVFVAPSLLGLLALGFWLAWRDAGMEGLGVL